MTWFVVTGVGCLPARRPVCRQSYLLGHLQSRLKVALSLTPLGSYWAVAPNFAKARGIVWLEGILVMPLSRGFSLGFDDP